MQLLTLIDVCYGMHMRIAPFRTVGNIGAAIRARRQELGLDQAELARHAGVSRLWIIEVEKGKPGAGIGRVLATFAALGLELSSAPVPETPEIDLPASLLIHYARKRHGL